MFAYLSRSLVLLMTSCVLMCTSGCYTSSGGGSGVDRDRQLNELSPEETVLVCESTTLQFRDVVDMSPESMCTLTGIFAADTPELCREQRDECIAREMTDPTTTPTTEIDCTTPEMIPDTCEATVGQLEDCLDAWVAQLDSRTSLYDCENAGNDAVRAELTNFSPPAACEPFLRTCATAMMSSDGG